MHALKRKSPLRRVVLASAATVSGMVLLLSLKPHTTPTIDVGAPVPSSSSSASSGSSGSSAGAGGSSGSNGSSGSSGSSKSTGTKTVTGDSVQTRWGPVQVRVTVSSGRITDVTAVEYPQENPRDQEINSYAIPQLTREALAAQSASIDTVSGATYTSDGYRQSLQSALDSAEL
ncbi:FMN-binding protein [Streptomyces yaanensis]|uniref:FMN-binding protein n=1 Tax=Streptomyces yaanensis TaxID=1142239 RepID=A0ABV7SJF4_9ACTN|nr:FMN-binding protein [Streptomyces sp. CGMCC 4.7035]WNC00746.1 FMN-binding protein [Streptomyces sp. CGMCC 4.7035]